MAPSGTAPGASRGEPVIRTRGLTKRYGELTAVDRLDLDVYPGEVFGLLGPNGAGKTTTILMLLGLSEPTSGTARVVGLDPARRPLDVKRRVGYMPDNVGFYGTLTGRENLRYTARLNGLPDGDVEDRLQSLLDQAGLAEAADRRVDTYSRGMRQRLGIADALVKDPDVMILDEPTVAIDPAGVAEVLDLIRSLSHERGVTMLLSSHLLHQVQTVCDRVGLFVAGKMVAEGPMAGLADQLAIGTVTIEVGAGLAANGGEAGDSRQEIHRILRSVSGVERVETDPRDQRMSLVTADSDVREAVAADLVRAGIPVWHIRRRGEELDEIYQRYFQQGRQVGADGGAS